jgi:hypothetical protein
VDYEYMTEEQVYKNAAVYADNHLRYFFGGGTTLPPKEGSKEKEFWCGQYEGYVKTWLGKTKK